MPGRHNPAFPSPVYRAESKASPKGTGYSMTIGAFDLDEFLADLRSDEGVDPAMSIAPMPPWWIEALVTVFASEN